MANTPDNLRDLASRLEKYYSSAHERMRAANRIYELDFSNLLTFDYPVDIHKSSTGRSIVDSFRNQIRTDKPTVVFRPVGPSTKAQQESAQMQRWGRMMLAKERALADIDPMLQCGFDALLRGAACKKIVVDSEMRVGSPPRKNSKLYDDWHYKATTSWPYVVRAVDPLQVLPPPGLLRPLPYIVEKQRRYMADILEVFVYGDSEYLKERGYQRFNPSKRDVHASLQYAPDSEVDWLEYWDKDVYVVEVDNQRIVEKENPYGFVPYLFEWSGLGRRDASGDPRTLAVGILTAVEGELLEEVKMKTALSAQTLTHVFPTILTSEDPNKLAKAMIGGAGRIIRHIPGSPPTLLARPEPNQNVLLYLNEIKNSISFLRHASLSGGREEGVGFGILQATMIGQALNNIRPVRMMMDRVGGETLNMMAAMARRLDLTFNLAGSQEEQELMLHGDGFQHYNFDVQFESVDPAEDDRALMIGEALRRARDLTRRTFYQKYAKHIVEDPDEEEAQLYVEMLMEQMVASGALTQLILSEAQQGDTIQQEGAIKEQLRQVVASPQLRGELQRNIETVAQQPGLTTPGMQTGQEVLGGVHST